MTEDVIGKKDLKGLFKEKAGVGWGEESQRKLTLGNILTIFFLGKQSSFLPSAVLSGKNSGNIKQGFEVLRGEGPHTLWLGNLMKRTTHG